jgi:hypothetical protein
MHLIIRRSKRDKHIPSEIPKSNIHANDYNEIGARIERGIASNIPKQREENIGSQIKHTSNQLNQPKEYHINNRNNLPHASYQSNLHGDNNNHHQKSNYKRESWKTTGYKTGKSHTESDYIAIEVTSIDRRRKREKSKQK